MGKKKRKSKKKRKEKEHKLLQLKKGSREDERIRRIFPLWKRDNKQQTDKEEKKSKCIGARSSRIVYRKHSVAAEGR